MANCKKCGVKIGLLSRSGDLCLDCAAAEYEASVAATEIEWRKQNAHSVQEDEKIHAVLLTTETAPNLNITKRIEIVTAEVAYGMNIFKDLFAGVRDIVGGRSEAVQKTMRDARRTALYELRFQTHNQ